MARRKASPVEATRYGTYITLHRQKKETAGRENIHALGSKKGNNSTNIIREPFRATHYRYRHLAVFRASAILRSFSDSSLSRSCCPAPL